MATDAARALHLYDRGAEGGAPAQKASVLTGIDVLESTHFAALREAAARHGGHLRLGLLTNQTGIDRNGKRTIDVLAKDAAAAVPGLELKMLFSPEHGIAGAKDSEGIGNSVDGATGLPVRSLYGAKPADRRPKPEDLGQLDAVAIDLLDAGVHFYTYEAVTGYFVEAAAKSGIELMVLDRPAFSGRHPMQGPVSDAGIEIYTNYMPLPVRHGLTLGEFARYVNGAKGLGAKLNVVSMQGWAGQYMEDTDIPWVNPSPNLRTPAGLVSYPGVALLEMTNVSVGRGTSTPFEVVGAAWIDGEELAEAMTARKIAGVTFTPTRITVPEDENHYPAHGQTVEAVRLAVTDRAAFDGPETGIELITALKRMYPAQFLWEKSSVLIANKATTEGLRRGDDPRVIAAAWVGGLHEFQTKTDAYRLYP